MRHHVAVSLVLAAAACRGSTNKPPHPPEATATRPAEHAAVPFSPAAPTDSPPSALADTATMVAGVAAAGLPEPTSVGAHLVTRYCGQCHAIPSPARQSAADWPATLRRMYLRMEYTAAMQRGMGRGMMGGGGGMMGQGMMPVAAPTAAERDTIVAYLARNAMREVALDKLPGASSAAAALFVQTCSRCHALPDPGQHVAPDWPAVVTRMREHMTQFNVAGISDAQARRIVAYLQRHAASGGR
jgi:cytochrome c2